MWQLTRPIPGSPKPESGTPEEDHGLARERPSPPRHGRVRSSVIAPAGPVRPAANWLHTPDIPWGQPTHPLLCTPRSVALPRDGHRRASTRRTRGRHRPVTDAAVARESGPRAQRRRAEKWLSTAAVPCLITTVQFRALRGPIPGSPGGDYRPRTIFSVPSTIRCGTCSPCRIFSASSTACRPPVG